MLSVSSRLHREGVIVAMMEVFVRPPRESCRIRVSLLSLQGTCSHAPELCIYISLLVNVEAYMGVGLSYVCALFTQCCQFCVHSLHRAANFLFHNNCVTMVTKLHLYLLITN